VASDVAGVFTWLLAGEFPSVEAWRDAMLFDELKSNIVDCGEV